MSIQLHALSDNELLNVADRSSDPLVAELTRRLANRDRPVDPNAEIPGQLADVAASLRARAYELERLAGAL